MSLLLKGRYGYYSPRNPEEAARARKRKEKRIHQDNITAAWLEKTRWCRNGCGKEAARYEDSPGRTLRFDGCCSAECLDALNRKGGAA